MPRKQSKTYIRWRGIYDAYQWPKCEWHLFYNRMYRLERPFEECIQPIMPNSWIVKKISDSNREVWIKKYKNWWAVRTNHRIEKELRYNPTYYSIDITYPTKEEREIIQRAYLREIQKIENTESDTPKDEVERLKKLSKLEDEYQEFLSYNPLDV